MARISRHHHGLHRALCYLADFDHIVDSDEMIVHSLAAVETGGAGFLEDRLKMALVQIAEQQAKSRLDQNSLPAGLVRRRELLNSFIKVGLQRVIFHTTILRKFSACSLTGSGVRQSGIAAP